MTKLTMLGTGNALVTECFNTCFVLDCDGKYIMVDGGGGGEILARLKHAGFDWMDMRDIIVTHKHVDHILGILYMVRMITQNMNSGKYEGEARIYGHDEVIRLIREISCSLLPEKNTRFFDDRLNLITVRDGETRDVAGQNVTFFDIHSTKAKQYGFRAVLSNGIRLVCCGDEPYDPSEKPYVKGCDWLLHEAFCLSRDAGRFHPYEKHHSTARDAAQEAEELGVRNLVLYHTEDETIEHRKALYTEEAGKYFSGNLYVPDDMETIVIE
ncbi:MAG: MBL fold metallo-hydrolase [Anaerovoracaceae bacterium]|jgi:ribonuclease Z